MVRIRNLRQLVELVDTSSEEVLKFELRTRGVGLHTEILVLEREAAVAADPDILKQNRITSRSRLSPLPEAIEASEQASKGDTPLPDASEGVVEQQPVVECDSESDRL